MNISNISEAIRSLLNHTRSRVQTLDCMHEQPTHSVTYRASNRAQPSSPLSHISRHHRHLLPFFIYINYHLKLDATNRE